MSMVFVGMMGTNGVVNNRLSIAKNAQIYFIAFAAP